jgi:hypothetical protein
MSNIIFNIEYVEIHKPMAKQINRKLRLIDKTSMIYSVRKNKI